MEKNIDAQILHTVVIHVAIRLSLTDSKAVSSPAVPGGPWHQTFPPGFHRFKYISTGLTSGFCFQVDF